MSARYLRRLQRWRLVASLAWHGPTAGDLARRSSSSPGLAAWIVVLPSHLEDSIRSACFSRVDFFGTKQYVTYRVASENVVVTGTRVPSGRARAVSRPAGRTPEPAPTRASAPTFAAAPAPLY